MTGIIIGRKAIVAFMRQYASLNDDVDEAYRTVKRWSKDYKFPLNREINGRPSVFPHEVEKWMKESREKIMEKIRNTSTPPHE